MSDKLKARILRYKILGIKFVFIANQNDIGYYKRLYGPEFMCLTWAVNAGGTTIFEEVRIEFTDD